MEYRRLGASGLKVPLLSLGTGTFAGQGPLFSAWGNTDAKGARRLVDICIEAGVTMFPYRCQEGFARLNPPAT
jgi:aryl-alcohol dehydrogenase-like predicted oxidoreductase